ncbi:MAG TPA: threonine aldolase family protein [Streptosporangiaceae bacterium]|nr:threonine aldolase family protein [Streptosporangiaceae bacterium]
MTARVDLRSDTVTRPTEAMRRAMATAEVGDDHFGDDPTVIRLEHLAAELTGKQAAVYLPTGTLCTQIALHVLVRSGHQVICDQSAHMCTLEIRSAAMLSGITFRTLPGSRGLLSAEQVAAALGPGAVDVRSVDLVAIENTHQVGGGVPAPVADVEAIAKACDDAGKPLYLDGARIFNATVVTGARVSDYAAHATAMMFCLSKGLGAPVGSLLVGDADFIREARLLKVLFGAGWRQAGVLAAAGLVALEEGPKRLATDHENAQILARGVADLLPGSVDPSTVATNIVFVDVAGTGRTPAEWTAKLAAEGLLTTVVAGRVRMLTHRDVDAADIASALAAWRRAAAA